MPREEAKLLRAKSRVRATGGEPIPFDRVTAIQAVKRVDYDLIRRVLYAGASAGYRVIQFFAMPRGTYQ